MRKFTLEQIQELVKEEDEIMQVEGKFALIVECKKPFKLLKAFQKKDDKYVVIDIHKIARFIAKRLGSYLNSEEFLKELLIDHSHPCELMELKERLENPDAVIKPAKQCYSFLIGGKRGRPYEFTLVT
ncbi:hypothetical protein ES705_50016 [subsurface metagenome]